MKRLSILFLLLAASAVAQTGLAARPDCDFGFVYNVVSGVITSTSSPSSPNRLPPSLAGVGIFGWDNRIPVCTTWTLYYQTEGVSAVSIELDQAPSVNGQPGSWVAWTNVSPGTTYPLTTLNVGQGSSFSYQPWVSVNLNSASGTGQVYGRVFGWKSAPGQSGTGITSEAGTAPAGSPPVGNPVLVGGFDGANVQRLSTDNTGRLNINSAAGTSNTNVTQFGSNNVVTGTGVGGLGIPRVTVSSDSFGTGASSTQVQGTAATGATPVANPLLSGAVNMATGFVLPPCVFTVTSDAVVPFAGCGVTSDVFNGTNYDRQFYCPNTATFSVASTTTQVVALSGSTKIRVCSVSLNPATATAGSVDLVYGTGAACGTGTTTLTGAFTLPASAVVNIPVPLTSNGPLITPAAQALCVRTATATVNGFITWAQY